MTTKLLQFVRRLLPRNQERAIFEFRALVRDELKNLPYPPGYVVSTRWAREIDDALRVVEKAQDPREIALFGMQNSFDGGLPPANADYLRDSRGQYNQQHPELSKIGESGLAPPNSVITIDGVTFSYPLDQAFSYYRGLVAGIKDERPEVVVEVGSGYGRFIRVLRLAGRGRHFILVDLPGSLLFAFAFLQLHFPDAKMHIVRSPADIYPDLATDFDFVFCPVQFLHHLYPRNVDLIVNTYSLGEMPQGCVDHIMQCIHSNLKPAYFYSFNQSFIDKNLFYDTSGYNDEGNDIVLNLKPEWWPLTFSLFTDSVSEGRSETKSVLSRYTINTVLKRVNMQANSLVADLIAAANNEQPNSDKWMGLMYLAALWTPDPDVILHFLDGLRARQMTDHFTDAPPYDFETVGEVRFLRRRLAQM